MQKPNWISDDDFDSLCYACLKKADKLKTSGMYDCVDDLDIFELSDLLIKLELEKLEKNMLSDCSIDYNDEIVSIQDVGELETIDIGVSGDNLFYCSDILTKNSMGLPMTVDCMVAMISTDELEELGQVMIKQIANRYADSAYYKRFVIGVNRAKMKFFDLEESAQKDIIDSGQDKDDDMPAFDKSSFGKRMKTAGTDFKF